MCSYRLPTIYYRPERLSLFTLHPSLFGHAQLKMLPVSMRGRRFDGRLQRELTVLDLLDDELLAHGVPLRPDGDRAGDPDEVLRGTDGIAQAGPTLAAGALEGVGENLGGVVAERGQGVGFGTPACPVLLDEVVHDRRRVIGEVMVGVEAALQGLAADLDQLRGLPAVAAEHGDAGHAEVGALNGDLTDVGVVAGH